jgi:hypothetical protein
VRPKTFVRLVATGNVPLITRCLADWLHWRHHWKFDQGSETRTRDAVLAVAGWVRRAQDAWKDGGISSRYDLLARHFQPQYPETTGYLVPTLLALGSASGGEAAGGGDAVAMAVRAGEWLRTRQLPDGAVDCRSDRDAAAAQPEIILFDCGAILQAFVALHLHAPGQGWADNAGRLADFMVSEQLASGEWKTHLYFSYFGSHQSLTAYALIDAGRALENQRYVEAGIRCLAAIRPRLAANGFVRMCQFTDAADDRIAFLHPLAYTLEGFLKSGLALDRPEYLEVVRPALAMLQRKFEIRRRLFASHYREDWTPMTAYSALDADCQIAALWFQFGRATGDLTYVSSALKLMDLIRPRIDVTAADPGWRGGIPGSFPVYGRNQQYTCVNWAAKYFLDASMLEMQVRRDVVA